jgi:hypothetical protein
VRAVPPTGSKETRATPLAAQAEAGNVKIVVKADWNEAFFAELENFPFGKHDDQVDSSADAFNELFDAVGAAGFLSMVRADNRVVLAAAEAEAEAEAAAEEADDGCPYPPGSMEYLRWHGLVPEQPYREELASCPTAPALAYHSVTGRARADAANRQLPGSFYGAGLPIPPVQEGQAVRAWDFAPGTNMTQTPRHTEPFGFRHLRAFSNVEMVRMAIETRKDQLERLDWMVKPKDEKLARKQERDPRCLEVEKFLAKPDGQTHFAAVLPPAGGRPAGD